MSNDYLIRMKLERNGLREKIDKLSVFLYAVDKGGKLINDEEYDLMKNQLSHMRQYLAILVQRIQLHEHDDDDLSNFPSL